MIVIDLFKSHWQIASVAFTHSWMAVQGKPLQSGAVLTIGVHLSPTIGILSIKAEVLLNADKPLENLPNNLSIPTKRYILTALTSIRYGS